MCSRRHSTTVCSRRGLHSDHTLPSPLYHMAPLALFFAAGPAHCIALWLSGTAAHMAGWRQAAERRRQERTEFDRRAARRHKLDLLLYSRAGPGPGPAASGGPDPAHLDPVDRRRCQSSRLKPAAVHTASALGSATRTVPLRSGRPIGCSSTLAGSSDTGRRLGTGWGQLAESGAAGPSSQRSQPSLAAGCRRGPGLPPPPHVAHTLSLSGGATHRLSGHRGPPSGQEEDRIRPGPEGVQVWRGSGSRQEGNRVRPDQEGVQAWASPCCAGCSPSPARDSDMTFRSPSPAHQSEVSLCVRAFACWPVTY